MIKILYFSSPYCGPCKMIGPIIEDVFKDCELTKIDVFKSAGMAEAYDISRTPSVIVNVNGDTIFRIIGPVPKHMYEQYLEEAKKFDHV